MRGSRYFRKHSVAAFAALMIGWILIPQSILAASNRMEWRDVSDQYVGYSRIWSDKDSALANGSDTIKIMGELYMVGPNCPDAATPCYQAPSSSAYRISVSGSGNSVTPTEISSGEVVFSIASTTAETKTVTMQNGGAYGSWGSDISIQISFTAPPAATATTNSSPAPASSSSTRAASSSDNLSPAATEKPEAPTLATINNQQLSGTRSAAQEITSGEEITFSGTTIANATVKLYIFSDPITAEVVSDQDGNWSYTLSSELEAGDHRVEAEVTDSSGNTSDRVEIARFTVSNQPKALSPDSTEPTTLTIFTPLNYALAGSAVILIGLLIFLIIRSRNKAKIKPEIDQSQTN